ncbi:MAG: imidazole glycerol phosphate synthase subunit HisH [Spirochaetota bacterium]
MESNTREFGDSKGDKLISSQSVAVVKYNAGNIRSVTCALNRLGITPLVTDDAKQLQQADKVIFPGVGEASTAMRYLEEHSLDTVLQALKQPFLGICLGLQLMCSYSQEHQTQCLGMFGEPVKLFPRTLKVPHMGWNTLLDMRGPLFAGLPADAYVYFVHSYYVEVGPDTAAACSYSRSFSAALQRNNFYGVQFHPEKSGPVGEQILKNFLSIGLESTHV